MKTDPSVYTVSIKTIYLSHSTQVAGGTVFREPTVFQKTIVCLCVPRLREDSSASEDELKRRGVAYGWFPLLSTHVGAQLAGYPPPSHMKGSRCCLHSRGASTGGMKERNKRVVPLPVAV